MSFLNLVGRVAIVTGATSCVGAATARRMVNLGMKVVGVSRKSLGAAQQDDIFSSQKGQTGEMFFIQGDVTKQNDISRIIEWTREKFGRTDVLKRKNSHLISSCRRTCEHLNLSTNFNMMLKNLANRVAIVTGASSCIGAATARQMVNLGMKVVGVSRKTPKRNEEGHTGEIVFVQGDVTQLRDINKILKWTRKEFGRTDVLVNAAGLFHNFTITCNNVINVFLISTLKNFLI
ncbi:uncharacterized protein LOC135942314 [Cloeon dipterum]|uniref:uncharacterized protein LOC135942314 n=1 Tax=Cloeon dipterum TaxID=197152 RepID=UPI00321FF68A